MHDNFFTITRRFEFIAAHPINPTESKLMTDVMKTILDFHPLIQSFAKVLLRCGEGTREIHCRDMTTWNKMQSGYKAVWMIDAHASGINFQGNIAEGMATLDDNLHPPPFMVDIHPHRAPCPILMPYGLEQ